MIFIYAKLFSKDRWAVYADRPSEANRKAKVLLGNQFHNWQLAKVISKEEFALLYKDQEEYLYKAKP